MVGEGILNMGDAWVSLGGFVSTAGVEPGQYTNCIGGVRSGKVHEKSNSSEVGDRLHDSVMSSERGRWSWRVCPC